ncbi:MAG: alpha/beta hydrolase [Candidatus Heimdallarchaeota archaeon]|nr:alpha/beta hydrolase [Candidatus Heimdallarchaeota archaeon]
MNDPLYYQKIDGKGSGNPTPLFLLHTSPLDHNYLLNSLPKGYVPSCPFYFVDLSSHGNSPDIENKQLSFKKLADQVDQLRNHLDLEKISIFGHGIGGFVAQYYATYHRKHTSALIISNSSPNHNYREEMAWNIRDNFSKGVKQKLADYEGRTDEESLRFKFKTSLTYHFSPPNEEKANELLESISRFPNDAYVIISNYLIPILDLRQYNQKLKIPVLIISGVNDVWPKSILKMFQTDIPNATYETLETGHFPMIEDPDNFWSVVNTWIAQI